MRLSGLFLLLAACGTSPDPARAPASGQAGDSASVTLTLGAQGTASGLQLSFAAVPEDSRCPSDVTCVWAGQGIVELRVAGGSMDTSLRLSTLDPREAVVGGYLIRLETLEPYPRTSEPAGEQYQATVLVVRRE